MFILNLITLNVKKELMKQKTTNILEILINSKSRDLNRTEINQLIDKSFQISIAFLKSKFSSQLPFLKDEFYTIEDIAMDAIIPLYINNKYGELGILRSLMKWNDKLESSSDAEYFLSRIIWRRVDQTVMKVFKQRDPIFDKILKSINVCIKNNNFIKVRYFGTVYVMQNRGSLITDEVISEESFNTISDDYFAIKHNDIFHKLFEHLIIETDYAPAIPLNQLVKRIKMYHASRLQSYQKSNTAADDSLTLDEIVDEGMSNLKRRLNDFYLTKNRISQEEFNSIYSAFNNISKDMLNGGIKCSLFKYLSDFQPSLSSDTFYSKYHHIMNYLLTGLKNNIAANLTV